jgi:hypothetical protein
MGLVRTEFHSPEPPPGLILARFHLLSLQQLFSSLLPFSAQYFYKLSNNVLFARPPTIVSK